MSKAEYCIVLVTPVWNDSKRFAKFGPQLASFLAESNLPIRWIVADDGSIASEQKRVSELVAALREIYPDVEAMLFEQRSYKGGAVYAAWDACPDADWLGFVDADGAIGCDSVLRLIEHATRKGLSCGCVGVRHDGADTPVDRPWGRVLSFRIFSMLVHWLVGIRFEDTQCGLKIIPGQGYRSIAGKLCERGYVFDVELLLALDSHGYCLEELRIPWREMAGGKVNPWRDAWSMLAGLWRIRKRVQSGAYLPANSN